MEHPEQQISHVIHLLTEGSPAQQQEALERYFLPDASFIHPICRVPHFSHVFVPFIGNVNSRWIIGCIYRWYKIMLPRVVLTVEATCSSPTFIGYNQKTSTLYCELNQAFIRITLPFYRGNAHLTTKLLLHHSEKDDKYYIKTQEDLYQSNEIASYFIPGSSTLVYLLQIFASLLCIVGAIVLAPITWLEQIRAENREHLNGNIKNS
ncbi:hypothetical protein GcM3_205023 [Golovinomyces cichoracearum]|uniref:SigF-like NTF2-like domain-containing protein n=1 Tax=Golovinomyces cichoracearum TaxID=62708 RepID=A0A420HC85_9PEZI|nr:hypothetical protein GcM3_205023 [Golovinomyces cichoracearum]